MNLAKPSPSVNNYVWCLGNPGKSDLQNPEFGSILQIAQIPCRTGLLPTPLPRRFALYITFSARHWKVASPFAFLFVGTIFCHPLCRWRISSPSHHLETGRNWTEEDCREPHVLPSRVGIVYCDTRQFCYRGIFGPIFALFSLRYFLHFCTRPVRHIAMVRCSSSRDQGSQNLSGFQRFAIEIARSNAIA